MDSSGNILVADFDNHTIRKITAAGVVTTLAGLAGSSGSADGAGSAARFSRPASLALDSSGNLFVIDYNNSTVRKVTPAGVVSTFAGSASGRGSTDGTGTAARFNLPGGIAIDASGNFYVSDTENRTIRKITPEGAVTTVAGSVGIRDHVDGTGSAARFNFPSALAVDASGYLFIADAYAYTIRKMSPSGVVTTLAGSAGNLGSADGTGNAARFNGTGGIAVAGNGDLYVADTNNHTIRRVAQTGVVTTMAGLAGTLGSTDGSNTTVRFQYPYGIAFDPTGNLIVGDTHNETIRKGVPSDSSTAPTITSQPLNQNVTAGANASFSVTVSGTTPFTYQWRKDGSNIVGATASTLSLSNVQAGAAGSYTVVVTNSAGSVTSSTATLTVTAAVLATTISAQPQAQSVTAGANASFSVTASGTAPFTYQWRKDGVNLSGATSATLSLSSVQAANAGDYTVVVSNSAGSVTSAAATLTVSTPPSIVTQPQGQSVTAGANVSFSVIASGTTPLSYQWRKDGSNIGGATNSTFSLGNVQSGDAGSYTVVVSNSAGSVTSSAAALTVTTAVVAPAITTPPQGQNVNAGSSVAFTVTASGSTPFTYQWRKDGSNVAGATGATFTLSNIQAADAGIYTVVVGNSAGSTTSNPAILTIAAVTEAPTITAHPQNRSVQVGGSITFVVTATGTAPLSYQWRKDGGNLSGATGASLALGNVQNSDAGSYSVVVGNGAGSVNSNAATLTVTASGVAPTVASHPESQTVGIGANVTLRVAASGTSPFSYQWRLNGADISGATSDTLILGLVAASSAGSYTVVVRNSFGSVTSNPATLNVIQAPTITLQPADQSVPVGANVVFRVEAGGAPPLAHQWLKDGQTLTGATNATLALTAVTNADAGTYRVVVSNGAGRIESREARLIVSAAVSKIINLSVRTIAGTGSETLIVGFVVGGQGTPKPVLVRGIGPSLAAFGVTGALADPALELYRGSSRVADNDNWGESLDVDDLGRAMTGAGAFALSERSRDAALLRNLPSGSYTAQVSARTGSGIALVELYDTEGMAATTRLANVSARSMVGTGAGVLIAGFVVQGNTPKTVLIRGIGPTLAAFGVTGALADPELSVSGGTTVVASNDEWWRSNGAQALPPIFASVGAFALVNGSHDAALVATLQPGSYTATLSGVGGTTGVALVEIYELP